MFPQHIGRYEVKRELGRGGMATVFVAFDPEFERDVAVKVLPREFLHDPHFRARFKREAKIIAALEHPAIVPVYDYGEDDGQPFIVMRLMPGGSLADRLKQGPLTLPEVARIFTRLAGALDEAHRRGIIHRDLKPGNILLDSQGDPYVSDFGMAKLTQGASSFSGSTIMGTPAYMSPEQAKGEHDLDGRSDIYALGAILFEMLTGKLPYDADSPMGIAVKHITEPVPRILDVKPDLPPGCEDVIRQAMAKDRRDRFPTANALVTTLQTLTAPSTHPQPSRPQPEPATQKAKPEVHETPTQPLGCSFVLRWALASAAGGAVGLPILALVIAVGAATAQAAGNVAATAIISAIGMGIALSLFGGAVAFAQWFVLRRLIPAVRWWVPASAAVWASIGLVLGFIVGIGAGRG
ncbi:MAG TPA: serine/threonine-protein kinase [Anaerolineales bacterium]|nr:serine/threonine-protein kinase [Anaerolineales bacterium]HLB46087.1 serine/threonine-protein kinase [Anaerolineales bacterium]